MTSLAIVNGTVLTIDAANHVYRGGTVVVEGDRIVAVGSPGEVRIPAGAEVIGEGDY